MKRIICLLISALLVSCSQVNNPTVVVPEPKKDGVLVNNTAKPQVNNDVKVEVKESIKPIIDPNTGIKDSVNYILTGVDKAVENLPSPTPTASPNPTPYPTVVSTPTPTPSPVVTPTPIPDPRANDPRYTTPAGVSIYSPTPAPTKIPYRIDNPIVEIENAAYELIFKDEYKVRYDKEKKQFYSLLGNDLKSVNDIFIKDNIIIYLNSTYNFTEEQMDLFEKQDQETGRYEDAPHDGSKYGLYATNITSVRELILKGRENIFVRQFNVYKATPTSNSIN